MSLRKWACSQAVRSTRQVTPLFPVGKVDSPSSDQEERPLLGPALLKAMRLVRAEFRAWRICSIVVSAFCARAEVAFIVAANTTSVSVSLFIAVTASPCRFFFHLILRLP